MKIRKNACSESGQTLLEVLLAFSIVITVLSAISIVVTTSLSNAVYTRNQSLANSYAQEGAAAMRSFRDSDLTGFNSKSGPYCLQSLALSNYDGANCSSVGVAIVTNNGNFTRTVELANGTPECPEGKRVTIKVSWGDSKCPDTTPYCHKVELITCLSTNQE
jgi:Tfp pilus assembly protein PilV